MAPRSTAEVEAANVVLLSIALVRAARARANAVPHSTAQGAVANAAHRSIVQDKAVKERANAVPRSTAQVVAANAARRSIVLELEANVVSHSTVQEDSYAHVFVTSTDSSKI